MSKLALRNPHTLGKSVFGDCPCAVKEAAKQLKKNLDELGCYTELDKHIEQVGCNLYATNVRTNKVVYL